MAQSNEIVACCDEELAANGAMSTYRWECCVAYDPAVTPDPNLGSANPQHAFSCTPWGPPVPPSMKRARRSTTRSGAERRTLEGGLGGDSPPKMSATAPVVA